MDVSFTCDSDKQFEETKEKILKRKGEIKNLDITTEMICYKYFSIADGCYLDIRINRG